MNYREILSEAEYEAFSKAAGLGAGLASAKLALEIVQDEFDDRDEEFKRQGTTRERRAQLNGELRFWNEIHRKIKEADRKLRAEAAEKRRRRREQSPVQPGVTFRVLQPVRFTFDTGGDVEYAVGETMTVYDVKWLPQSGWMATVAAFMMEGLGGDRAVRTGLGKLEGWLEAKKIEIAAK